jgi:DNA invertase Pin-like site-specific DNA recombinase
MMTTAPKAYSYLRFSTPEQAQGDSFRRQTEAARAYALRHGLDLDEKLTFQDLGVSAFRGGNLEVGKLGVFLEAVRAGLVQPGSYLLVENLDRISRDKARRALRVLEDICDAGITLVTLNDGREYTRENLDSDPTSLILSILTFMRANEESETKARRLRSAWEAKRSKALDRPLTAKCPAWLVLDKEAGRFEVIEDRAAIVRRVYAMTLQGYGQHAIAETLNKEGVPAFKGSHWHRSYIVKLLGNPSVIGTLVPHVLEFSEDRKKTRKPLDPVPGYYPAVVDEDSYQRVQAMRMGTISPLRGRHAKGQVLNIFGGLARCPACGSTMTRVYKGKRGGRPYLVCTKAKAGAGCVYKTVPYQQVEDAFLAGASWTLAHCPGDSPEGQQADDDLDAIETAISVTEDSIENLLDALQASTGIKQPALLQRLSFLQEQLDAMRKEREALQQKAASMAGPLLMKRLDALGNALERQPLNKTEVNTLLRQLLSDVVVDYNTGLLILRWKHGGESDRTYAWVEPEE